MASASPLLSSDIFRQFFAFRGQGTSITENRHGWPTGIIAQLAVDYFQIRRIRPEITEPIGGLRIVRMAGILHNFNNMRKAIRPAAVLYGTIPDCLNAFGVHLRAVLNKPPQADHMRPSVTEIIFIFDLLPVAEHVLQRYGRAVTEGESFNFLPRIILIDRRNDFRGVFVSFLFDQELVGVTVLPSEAPPPGRKGYPLHTADAAYEADYRTHKCILFGT